MRGSGYYLPVDVSPDGVWIPVWLALVLVLLVFAFGAFLGRISGGGK